MFQRDLTEEEIAESILKGHEMAHDFMATSPTWDQLSSRISMLQYIASHSVENFYPNSYILKNNKTISESAMKKTLLCAFRATQELKELEQLRDRGSNVIVMKRAAYLDSEVCLPLAVTVFRSNGTEFDPDYGVAKILNNHAHLTAA